MRPSSASSVPSPADPHRVDPERRPQIFAEAEIGGGKADRAAAPVAGLDASVDLPEAAELRRRLSRPAVAQEFADMGRGIDRGVGAAHRLDDCHPETVPRPRLAQHLGGAAALVAEGQIVADYDMADTDRADQQVVDEQLGRPSGEGRVEMLHEQKVDAEPRDLALLDAERGQPERLGFRHEHGARVRLERQHRRRQPLRPGAPARLADQRRMAEMQPVEISHRQHRAARVGRIGTGVSDDAQHGKVWDSSDGAGIGAGRKIAAAMPGA